MFTQDDHLQVIRYQYVSQSFLYIDMLLFFNNRLKWFIQLSSYTKESFCRGSRVLKLYPMFLIIAIGHDNN